MTKREWLVSQGLAQGTRGRFSREAELAWDAHMGNSGDTPASPENTVPDLPRDGFNLAKLPQTYPRVRDENTAYTIDEAGHMIAHGNCGKCKRLVSQCACAEGVHGLSYIKPPQLAYLVKEN